MSSKNWLIGIVALFASATMAFAQECSRGDLDKTYCDRNGDLVAECPTIRSDQSIRRR